MTKSPDFGRFSSNLFRFSLNYLARYCFAGIVIYSCWVPLLNRSWFSWHVILCTLGLIPFMAEALMLFAPDELWSRQLTRTEKYWIHGGLMVFGTVLVSAGSIVTFVYIEPDYHLYTVHGITGLISMICFILAVVQGITVNYVTELKEYIRVRPILQKFLHNSFGVFGYVVGMVSLCYAYYTNWFVFYTSVEGRYVVLGATIVATVWSLNAALISGFNQIKTIFN